MEAIEFEGVNVRIAENQDEYLTLPAFYNKKEGSVMYAFKLDEEELKEVKETGIIFWKQLTGGKPMQPIGLSTLRKRLEQ